MRDHLLQKVIQKYPNRDQLIQEGIWEGNLYKIQSNSQQNSGSDNHADFSTSVLFDRRTRGWIWKTLVLPVLENDTNFLNTGYLNNNVNLLPVPILSSNQNSNNSNVYNTTTHHHHHHTRVNSLEWPIKNLSQGIRKLTPRETYIHPLRKSTNHHPYHGHNSNHIHLIHHSGDNSNNNMETDSLTLQDTLEIIDLDLSRLVIDDIFMEPTVHAEMRQIMFNYLVHLSLQKNSNNPHINTRISSAHANSGLGGAVNTINVSISNMKFDHLNTHNVKYYYKQGFHEILGLIFLQLYDPLTTNKESYMKNTLFIFETLMNQIEPIFYNEANLIHWEETIFAKMLQLCSQRMYRLFYYQTDGSTTDTPGITRNQHSNMIWLIRWTRLLFLRELPMEKVYIIWDHLLTFTFPIKTYVASLIVIIILHLNDAVFSGTGEEESMDNDDLTEIMLHVKNQPCIINMDSVRICQLAGTLTELWYLQKFDNVKSLITDRIVKEQSSKIDPYRKRMEEKLRQRVQQSLK